MHSYSTREFLFLSEEASVKAYLLFAISRGSSKREEKDTRAQSTIDVSWQGKGILLGLAEKTSNAQNEKSY